jgi:hypothetical protein
MFNAVVLENTSLPASDRSAMIAFHKKIAELNRVMHGTEDYAEMLYKRTSDILASLNSTPAASPDLVKKASDLHFQLDEILNVKFNRHTNKPSVEENPPAPVPLNARLEKLTDASFTSTSQPTQLQLDAYKILEDEFPAVYNQVKMIGEKDIPDLENAMENIGAPVTPARLPVWHK